MDYVTLAPGLPHSSRLGFGCGSIMGRVGKTQSLNAIAAALDAGVTHFDVARLYGYGEAESLLGEALGGRRDRVVIASKFGLQPPRAAAALRGLKPLVQKVVGAVPGLRPLLRSAIGTTARTADRFSVPAARASLEASLAALGTDYLDILFLHDCRAEDVTDELLEFLREQVTAGKIRSFGAATDIDTVTRLHGLHGDTLIYQFANSAVARNAELLPAAGPRIIAHSPFRGADRASAASPGRNPAQIHALMLAYALRSPNVSVVLCSMLNPAHLRANLQATEGGRFTAADFAPLATLPHQP